MEQKSVQTILKTVWGIWVVGLVAFAVLYRVTGYPSRFGMYSIAAMTVLLLVTTAIHYHANDQD
jgi:FtsH-binding integral membrane protein